MDALCRRARGWPRSIDIEPNRITQENAMHLQNDTDGNIEVHGVVESTLSSLGDRTTRREAHLGEHDGDTSGRDDRRRAREVHRAATLDDAVDGAADELKRSVESTLAQPTVLRSTT